MKSRVTEVPFMKLLSPAPDKCQECAVKHDSASPHDACSLYYGIKFKMENGRSPTWEDAMKNCDEDIKRVWRDELNSRGIDTTSTSVRGK